MSSYRDPTFDKVAGLEKKRGVALALEVPKPLHPKDTEQIRWEKRKKIRRIMQKIMSK